MSTDNLKKKKNSAFGCYYYNYVSDGTNRGHCFASSTRDGDNYITANGQYLHFLVIFKLRVLVLLH